MSIDDITGYAWRRAVGAVGSGIALTAMLYAANPQVAYSQGGRDVDVVMKDGKVVVRPQPLAPAQQAPAAPKVAAGPAAGKQQSSSPSAAKGTSAPVVKYGTSPICGTDETVTVDKQEINLKEYQCLTPAEAQAKSIDRKSGLPSSVYTHLPEHACPGQKLCYKLPVPVEPRPSPLDTRLGGIERTLEDMGKAELERQRLETERLEKGTKLLSDERERQHKQLEDLARQLSARGEAERLRTAEPLIPFNGAYVLAEVLSGDARGLLAVYGAGAAFHVAANVDLEVAGGMLHQLHQYGTLKQRTSPDPSTERRLLPDGTTYKLTEDSTTVVTTDKPTGFFGRVRGAYQTPLNWLKAFVGTDVRGREEGETATDYQKTISLERNDRPLRAPKTISDTVEQDADWNAGLYLHGGAQACHSFGPVTGCLEAQGGYDFHTESPNYGGGVRLGFE